MSDKVPSLFGNLSLRHWYKYLLYLSGILLVIGLIIETRIPNIQVVSFSIWTVILMVILWLIDDAIYFFGDENNIRDAASARFAVHGLVFFIWILMTLTVLL